MPELPEEAVDVAESAMRKGDSPNFIGTANRLRTIKTILQVAAPAIRAQRDAELRERLEVRIHAHEKSPHEPHTFFAGKVEGLRQARAIFEENPDA